MSTAFVPARISDATPNRITVAEIVDLDDVCDIDVRWVPEKTAVGARLTHDDVLDVADEDWGGPNRLAGTALARRLGQHVRSLCRGGPVETDEPTTADFEWFAEQFGEPTATERRAFALGYCDEYEG